MPNSLLLFFEDWRIKEEIDVMRVYHRDICMCENYREFTLLRKAINKHRSNLKGVGERCIVVIHPKTFQKISVDRSSVDGFQDFLNTAERRLGFLREIEAQCILDKCPNCDCEPEWYFTLN